METEMKHISFEERKLQEIQEIAAREGRKDYDLIREAVAQYLRDRETEYKEHSRAPGEGIVRPNDRVYNLEFNEMWIAEDGKSEPHEAEPGDMVRAIEDAGSYFTYYKFLNKGEYFVCQQVAPIKYELLSEFNDRTDKYRV